jgi:hypothetical protein
VAVPAASSATPASVGVHSPALSANSLVVDSQVPMIWRPAPETAIASPASLSASFGVAAPASRLGAPNGPPAVRRMTSTRSLRVHATIASPRVLPTASWRACPNFPGPETGIAALQPPAWAGAAKDRVTMAARAIRICPGYPYSRAS